MVFAAASQITSRSDGRDSAELRPLHLQPGIAPYADGSVLIATGNTRVICAVTAEPGVPRWMKEQSVAGGWITAEYSMLPYSTLGRRPRDISKGKLDGRSVEIQRLIGRAVRAVVNLEKVGERTLWIDCDVLQADGGTRTAAITGAVIALAMACGRLLERGDIESWPLQSIVAAVSVGVVDQRVLVDLNYEEDKRAAVDLNLVMNHLGHFIEVQGAGEEATFSTTQLTEMLDAGQRAITKLIAQQRAALAEVLPENFFA